MDTNSGAPRTRSSATRTVSLASSRQREGRGTTELLPLDKWMNRAERSGKEIQLTRDTPQLQVGTVPKGHRQRSPTQVRLRWSWDFGTGMRVVGNAEPRIVSEAYALTDGDRCVSSARVSSPRQLVSAHEGIAVVDISIYLGYIPFLAFSPSLFRLSHLYRSSE